MFGALGLVGVFAAIGLAALLLMESDEGNAGRATTLGFIIAYTVVVIVALTYIENSYINSPEYQQYQIRSYQEKIEKLQEEK